MSEVSSRHVTDWDLRYLHNHGIFIRATIHSGEPLPKDPKFPLRYVYCTGEETICHTREALIEAERCDIQLTVWPSLISVFAVVAALSLAMYFY